MSQNEPESFSHVECDKLLHTWLANPVKLTIAGKQSGHVVIRKTSAAGNRGRLENGWRYDLFRRGAREPGQPENLVIAFESRA